MRRPSSALTCALLLLAAIPSAATAEEPAPAAGKPAEPQTLLEQVLSGGPLHAAMFGVLILFSVVELAIVLERLVNTRAGRLVPPGFLAEFGELVRRGEADPEAYRSLCRRYDCPVSEVVRAGLLRVGRPLSEMEKAMEDAAAREAAALRGRIRPLTVLGNVGPLVGLLGTVFGMIMAFKTASQGGLGKAELLAAGIYVALETTVAGLIIAIPAMMTAAFFHARIETIMRVIDVQVMEAMPVFAKMEEQTLRRPAPGPVLAEPPAAAAG